ARELLDSIDTSTLVGLRDRALISVMTFAFARIGAAVAMRVEDYYPKGKRWWVRLHEKGGKRHEMPAHHNLEAYLDAYIKAAGIGDEAKSPLFRSAAGRTGTLTEKPMNRVDAWRMIQRRAADLGTEVKIGCHTLRATGITAYLEAGGTLENAQAMAAHESPRTTKLYDRTGDEITLDEVERINDLKVTLRHAKAIEVSPEKQRRGMLPSGAFSVTTRTRLRAITALHRQRLLAV